MSRYVLFLILFFFFATPVTAQPTLIFESEPGFRLTELGELIPTVRGRFDYNGDGIRDLSLIRGNIPNDTLFVMDLTVREVIAHWPIADVEALASVIVDFRFIGFFDVDGNGLKEAAFYDPEAQVLALTAQIDGRRAPKQEAQTSFVVSARSFAVLDLDGDEHGELIVSNPQTETVQVYGSSTGTATEDAIEAALAPLLENYPNPFRERTTIAYEVHQAGPVTLAIYDLLGRTIATLVDARQPVGRHHVTWDGRNASGQPLAAGTYFYRLQVGETISSKQAIRTR
ncbi:MAG TPA: FlgD immunoglobulin-like domain containing protein [Rhodothermales bacterium]|nr:FlgD immunoglobulin-like domain containing protein [Rhodothermales bacterium]